MRNRIPDDSAHWKSLRRPQAAIYVTNSDSAWFNGSGDGMAVSPKVMRSWVPLQYRQLMSQTALTMHIHTKHTEMSPPHEYPKWYN